MKNTLLSKTRDYAYECHSSTNHLYGNKPYSVHLNMAFNFGFKYRHLINFFSNKIDPIDVLAGIFVHDTIEDTRQTFNDVKKFTNEEVANIAYALTNEKGRTRKERANLKYYCGIRETPGATFVKICDRLANAQYSKDNNSRMFEAYRDEFTDFFNRLYAQEYLPMFFELAKILNISYNNVKLYEL